MHLRLNPIFSLVAIAMLWLPWRAQAQCTSAMPECVVVGEWNINVALGAGMRTNPIAGRSDIPLVLIPEISYYGKRFFIESLEAGVTLIETEAHTMNLIATPGYDRVFFHRSDPQNLFVGLSTTELSFSPPQEYITHRRRTTYLIGAEWLYFGERFSAQLTALHEATGRHDGFEVRAGISLPLIQSKYALTLSSGGTWKSAATVDYYYGVRQLYSAGAAFSPFIKLSYRIPVSERWTFNAFTHFEHLGDAIADSPIVSDRSVVTAFAGFTFKVL